MQTSHQQLQLSRQICLHGNLCHVLTLWPFPSTQDESLKTRKKEREDLGVELYGVQQELARYQMMLERNHDNFSQLNQQRQREEQQLTEVRGLYKDTQLTFNKEKKKGQACFAFIFPGQELYSSSKVKQPFTSMQGCSSLGWLCSQNLCRCEAYSQVYLRSHAVSVTHNLHHVDFVYVPSVCKNYLFCQYYI